ncbi:apoptosis-inducing factor homolog B-like [Impatiens glandulifera]|uniref:apoptosis-inducing factor homolog B-like n=1 Tax=Impatiens glandulifera TaxID=253017 RepID=UPI001FB05A34|nr:apoptosis-inducing factor homolog B-like [Impatiens glandulifera]
MGSLERRSNGPLMKKRVVVIGGGVAGSLSAKLLQDNANVTLIDSKEYFELPWATVRSLVEPSFAERSIYNHIDYLKKATVVVSSAANITETEVITAQGHLIPYDYLVIATGHETNGFIKKSDTLSSYHAESEKIKSAKSILVIGGGPTGVELAGEIAVNYCEKRVILVHRGSRLLEFISPKASKKAFDWLISKKVDVILDQHIELDHTELGVYRTSSGEAIAADCHYDCIGKPMGSTWLKRTIVRNSLDINGRLMVDAHLRVKGHKNVFGVGDITDVPEIKQGYLAQRHAKLAVKNLLLLIKGRGEMKMAVYRPSWPLAIVSLGRKDAVGQFFCLALSGFVPSMMKSRGLFVANMRKLLGIKPD